jgi:acetyl-CoA carboxylase biotin carboxylase subunit
LSVSCVLIANRGEIAVRIVRACRGLGIESVVAVSEADKDGLAARLADRAVCIGPARAGDSYLNQAAVLAAARGVGADAIHPGYGFLAENPAFAEACESHGMGFVGPRSETIASMGNKLEAREVAARHGVPLVPGSAGIVRFEEAARSADDLGYPVLFKAAAGGGGRGIRVVHDPGELRSTFEQAGAEAAAAFGDGTVYLERYVATARHIEVQVFADRQGQVVHLGERDCSLQRRYQKTVEEAPASSLPDDVRASMRVSAVVLAEAIGYENAGTVEFLYDEQRNAYYFLEMNTRIQVEHPVTEAVTGLDLVQMQLMVASGDPLPLSQDDVRFSGHAIECRVTAESPENGFRPAPGRIVAWRPPEGPDIRLETHCFDGYLVPPFYDSLLAKLVVHGRDRAEAVERMQQALGRFEVTGVDTSIGFLSFLVKHPDFRSGRFDTGWLERNLHAFRPGLPSPADDVSHTGTEAFAVE